MSIASKSKLYFLTLLVFSFSVFNCNGMDPELDRARWLSVLLNTREKLQESVKYLLKSRSESDQEDVEMGAEDTPKHSRRCCLTPFNNNKRAALVTALLALSVAGGGGAYMGLRGSNPSASSAEVTPATPLSPAMMSLHNKRAIMGIKTLKGSKYGFKTIAAADVSFDGTVRVKIAPHDTNEATCNGAFDYFGFGHFLSDHRSHIDTCDEVGALNDRFGLPQEKFRRRVKSGREYVMGVLGDNFDTNGTCQGHCLYYLSNVGGSISYRCRSKTALDRYVYQNSYTRRAVDPKALDGLTCSFKEEKRAQQLEQKHQQQKFNATHPKHDRHARQAKQKYGRGKR